MLPRPFDLLLSHLLAPRVVPEPFGLAINNLSIICLIDTGKNRNDWHKAAHNQASLLRLALCHLGNRRELSICAIARRGREKATASGGLWSNWLRL
jgi:hypothetical protein